ncbi:zinc finger 25 [Pelobates cultripes]|uniref:Zinc finger 25 n=1 Tax=Pelobates cultripes TaxID=61616 RepID=A0AAD1VQW2_PELCU|nr:zinc finger 25 [Pelobates cultripes]
MMKGPLTFEDVAVCFSEDEWKGLQEREKDLYREVMRDNYHNLSSLGFSAAKPEIVLKIERGEDPFVVTKSAGHQHNSSKYTIEDPGVKVQKEPRWNLRSNIPLRSKSGQKRVTNTGCSNLHKEELDRCLAQKGTGRLMRQAKRMSQTCRKETLSKVRTDICPTQQASSNIPENGIKDTKEPSQPPEEQCEEILQKSLKHKRNSAVSLGKHSALKEEDITQETLHFSGLMESSAKPFICVQCGESWNLLSDLLSHQMGQCQVRPFRCNICAKTFVKKQHLSAHKRTHSEEKPYTCGQCGRSFRQSSTLTTHLWSHAGLKPFHCSCCPKCFSRKTDLVAHMRRHTGERPYECPYCWERFIRKKSLQRHLQKHNGETLRPGWEFNCPRMEQKHNLTEGTLKQEKYPRQTLSTSINPTRELYLRWNDNEEKKFDEEKRHSNLCFSKNVAAPVVTGTVKMESEEVHIPEAIKARHQTTQTEPQKKKVTRLHQNMLKELKRFRRTSVRSQQEWDSMRLTMNQLSEEVTQLKKMVATLCAANASASTGRVPAELSSALMSSSYPLFNNPERTNLCSDDRLSVDSNMVSPESSLLCTPNHPLETLSETSKDHSSWMCVTSSQDEDNLLATATATTPIKKEADLEAGMPPGRVFFGASQFQVGERLPNISMLPLSAEKEWTLLARSGGKPGRFAALVFRALVPFDIYKGWVNHVNLDGLRGRKGIPLNVKRRMMGVVERHFTLRKSEHREIRNRLNEQLRTRRKSDKHPRYFY